MKRMERSMAALQTLRENAWRVDASDGTQWGRVNLDATKPVDWSEQEWRASLASLEQAEFLRQEEKSKLRFGAIFGWVQLGS